MNDCSASIYHTAADVIHLFKNQRNTTYTNTSRNSKNVKIAIKQHVARNFSTQIYTAGESL